MQKYIVCGKCSYFPNKADQVKNLQVKIQANIIEWYCAVCQKINRYPNRQTVMLPESSLVQLNKDNLLTNECKNSVKNIKIVMDFNNVKASIHPFYMPCFKEQISKICGVKQQNLKDMDILQSQSSWFAKYRQILRSFTKFLRYQSGAYEQNSQAGYLIYLIHCYILSLAKQGSKLKLSIFVLSKNSIYCFDIDEIEKLSNHLISFLKVYSLLLVEDKIPWLLNIYCQQLAEYKIQKKTQCRIDKLMLIGDHYQLNEESIGCVLKKINIDLSYSQLLIDEKIIILKFVNSNSDSKIYLISPYFKQSFINYIKNQGNIQNDSQQAIIYFKTKRSKQILIHKVKGPQIEKVKVILLNKPVSQSSLKDACKQLIQENKQQNKLKLIKIFCAFNIANDIKIVLFTFNWHKLQKQVLFEELDQEISEQHQLKEDILSEDIIKLDNPSPFMKKANIYLKMQDQNQTIEEDYQYL